MAARSATHARSCRRKFDRKDPTCPGCQALSLAPVAVRPDRSQHYRWCAEYEGTRAITAIRAGQADRAYFHARDAAYHAGRLLAEFVRLSGDIS